MKVKNILIAYCCSILFLISSCNGNTGNNLKDSLNLTDGKNPSDITYNNDYLDQTNLKDPLVLTEEKILPKPENTTLSYWITQIVTDDDFKDCTFLPGLFGGSEYLDGRYEAVVTEHEGGYKSYSEPDIAVIYTTTSYPDYASKTRCVTGIEITDPAISVYGLTREFETKEIQKTMLGYGFKQYRESTFRKNNCNVSFSNHGINLVANVTNVEGIQF